MVKTYYVDYLEFVWTSYTEFEPGLLANVNSRSLDVSDIGMYVLGVF